MSDKEFIKKFQKLTLTTICRELGVNYYNISTGRAGYDTTRKVVLTIQEKLSELLYEKFEKEAEINKILD